MARFLALLLTAVMLSSIYAQKQDNIWEFGYDYSGPKDAEGFRFEFSDSLKITYHQRSMALLDSYASICDSLGNLILLSNGCYIEDGNEIYIDNSYGLNPGILGQDQCYDDSSGYNVPNSMMLLNDPVNSKQFHLFHIRNTVTPQLAFWDGLLHTLIDIQGSNSTGVAVYKNRILVNDTLSGDKLHAVRHANGRDWWLIVAKQLSNKYYVILLSDSLLVKEQSIGEPTLYQSAGEMIFSPDGSKVARFNAKDDLRIFDFDRCTGELSNPLHITITDNADNEIFAGLAWSANGRYLYAAEAKRMLQFDTWSSDIGSTKIILSEQPNNPDCSLGNSFGFMELGPDGRIYCRPFNGQKCMHRINYPDRGGLASGLDVHYYKFTYPYKNMPHFPNFRLGPIDGSPCDTLGLDNHPLAGWRHDFVSGLTADFTSVYWYEPTTWWWDFGDNSPSVTERNPTHTFPAPGQYEVCLTVSNQYGGDTKCKKIWITTVGAGEPEAAGEALKVYPNPTSGEVFWTGIPDQPVHAIRVVNGLGQVAAEIREPGPAIQLGYLPGGLYILQWLSEDGTPLAVRKLQIVKE